jgi:hypothetical protein
LLFISEIVGLVLVANQTLEYTNRFPRISPTGNAVRVDWNKSQNNPSIISCNAMDDSNYRQNFDLDKKNEIPITIAGKSILE